MSSYMGLYRQFTCSIYLEKIVAFAIFLVVKAMNKMKAEEEAPEEEISDEGKVLV